MHAHVRKGARLQALRVECLTPALREVRALVSSHELPRRVLTPLLQPATECGLASARTGPQMLADARVPEGLRKHMVAAFNDSQMKVHIPWLSCLHESN